MEDLLKKADDESLELWKNLKLGYTESPGNSLLRYDISKLYKKIKLDNVLVIIPEEGIFIVMNSILKEGDHAIVTFPAYQSLYEISN